MHFFNDLFCAPIYRLANKVVTRCRSEKERAQLNSSFNQHFKKINEYQGQAKEYKRIMAQKETLFDAVEAVKFDAECAKKERGFVEDELSRIKRKLAATESLLSLICQLRADNNYKELDSLILTLSKQYNKIELLRNLHD